MLLIEGLFLYRLLKWEKLELQYQRFGWCLSTKQLLVARLPLELLILHLDGKYYGWNFLLEMWGNRKPKLGFMTCKEQKKKKKTTTKTYAHTWIPNFAWSTQTYGYINRVFEVLICLPQQEFQSSSIYICTILLPGYMYVENHNNKPKTSLPNY